MNLLRNLVASLITFFLVPLLLIWILASSVFGTLTNHKEVKSILSYNQTFSKLASPIIPTLLINSLTAQASENLVPGQVINLVIDKIDKQALATDLEQTFDTTYDYLVSDKTTFEKKVDLTKYTKTIADNLKPSYESYFQALPTCTASEEKSIGQTIDSTLKCRPKNLDVKAYLNKLEVESLVTDINSNLPTQLIINENEIKTYPETTVLNSESLTTQKENKASPIANLKKIFHSYESNISLIFLATIFLSLILAAVRLPSLGSASKWLSSAFFSASLLPLVGATLLRTIFTPKFFQNSLVNLTGADLSSKFGSTLINLAADNVAAVAQKILGTMQTYSLILIIIAIVLFALSFFFNNFLNQEVKKPLDEIITPSHNIGK